MVRILTIDDYTLKEVEKVKKYAEEHPCDENYRIMQMAGIFLPVGDNPDHVVHIHQGFRAVYCVSVIKEKCYHHLSISYEEEGRLPQPPEVQVIMNLFGLGEDLHNLDTVWLEEEVEAINLLKEIK